MLRKILYPTQFNAPVIPPKPPPKFYQDNDKPLRTGVTVAAAIAVSAQFSSFVGTPVFAPPTPTPTSVSSDSTVVIHRRILAQSVFHVPQKIVAIGTPQGFRDDFSISIKAPLSASQQRFADFVPRGAIVSTTPQGWWGQSPEQFVKFIPAFIQQFAEFAPFGSPLIFSIGGGTDTTIIQHVRFLYQSQFNTIPPPFVTFIQGWQFQQPEQIRKPFPVALQRFPDFAPAGFIALVGPPTAWPWSPSPDQFARLFNAALQRFADFVPQGRIVSITPQGWWGQSPDQFAQPYKVSLQQFAEFAPFGPFPPPQGWWGQSPDQFKAPYQVSLQQFGEFAPFVAAPTLPPSEGWQFQQPEQFGRPFPVGLQQFSANQLLGVVPPPPPTPRYAIKNIFAPQLFYTIANTDAFTVPNPTLPPVKVYVNEPAHLMLRINHVPSTSILLYFVRPDGTNYFVDQTYIYLSQLRHGLFIDYTSAVGEFGQTGWWLVQYIIGNSYSQQFSFYINPLETV